MFYPYWLYAYPEIKYVVLPWARSSFCEPVYLTKALPSLAGYGFSGI